MSASERLKALDALARTEPQSLDSGLIGLEWDQAATALTDALPQIVAVVSAAEACDPGGPGWFGDPAEGDPLAAALAALEQALSDG